MIVLTIVVLTVLLVVSWLRLDRMTKAEHAEHAKCMALIASFVGDEFAASVLEAAADRYGSVDGQADLYRVRDQWNDDGPSVPSLWLLDRAAQFRAKHDG